MNNTNEKDNLIEISLSFVLMFRKHSNDKLPNFMVTYYELR